MYDSSRYTASNTGRDRPIRPASGSASRVARARPASGVVGGATSCVRVSRPVARLEPDWYNFFFVPATARMRHRPRGHYPILYSTGTIKVSTVCYVYPTVPARTSGAHDTRAQGPSFLSSRYGLLPGNTRAGMTVRALESIQLLYSEFPLAAP